MTGAQGCSGRSGTCPEPPAYVWTGPHGGEYRLCIAHCAEWRVEVRGTGSLEPRQIRSITPELR